MSLLASLRDAVKVLPSGAGRERPAYPQSSLRDEKGQISPHDIRTLWHLL